jgi:hypothetical protein
MLNPTGGVVATRRLSQDVSGVLEAELREISLGQLVGMLIEAAMAQDLSRVLDKKARGRARIKNAKPWPPRGSWRLRTFSINIE